MGKCSSAKKVRTLTFFCRRLFDPEGLGAEAGQFSKKKAKDNPWLFSKEKKV
jgi:hypothetical protein